MSEKLLTIYAAGGVAAPLQEVCALFSKNKGIPVKHFNAKGFEIIQRIHETGIGDLASFGAEVLSDKLEGEGLVDGNHRYQLGTRQPVILVKAGNPFQIKTIDDLINKNVRIGVAYDGCLIGVWESIVMRHNPQAVPAFRKNVSCLSDGCGRLVRYLIEDEADAIIGWNTFQNFKPKAMLRIDLPKNIQIHRSTNVSLLKCSKMRDEALELIEFIRSDTGREIYQKHGWTLFAPY